MSFEVRDNNLGTKIVMFPMYLAEAVNASKIQPQLLWHGKCSKQLNSGEKSFLRL